MFSLIQNGKRVVPGGDGRGDAELRVCRLVLRLKECDPVTAKAG